MQATYSKFQIQVDLGDVKAIFSEVSGVEIPPEKSKKLEQLTLSKGLFKKSSRITLRNGTIKSVRSIDNWITNKGKSNKDRKNITISLLLEDKEPVVVWAVKNAWPVKVTPTDLKADGNDVAIENLELAHEGLTIKNE